MKRLLVTCDFPPISGGQSKYFKNLWAELSITDDTLLIPSLSRPYCVSKGVSNARFFWLPRGEWFLPRIWRLVGLIFAMSAAARATRPAAIHAGQIMAGGTAALWCKKTMNIPYYVYAFGSDIMEFENHPIGRWLIRLILNNSTGIICCSGFTADHIKEQFSPPVPVHAINPGVEDQFFAAADPGALRRKLGIADKTVLLTVGRLVKRKGHELVIRNLVQLAQTVPNIHYLVVGDGSIKAGLEKIAAQCGVSDRITFTGPVGDAELASFYHAADLFIMTTRKLGTTDVEGFGIVYLEANAAGLPVIAVRSGGVEEAVRNGKSGILLEEPATPEIIARTAGDLLNDKPRLSAMSVWSREWARSMSWETKRREWEDLQDDRDRGGENGLK